MASNDEFEREIRDQVRSVVDQAYAERGGSPYTEFKLTDQEMNAAGITQRHRQTARDLFAEAATAEAARTAARKVADALLDDLNDTERLINAMLGRS